MPTVTLMSTSGEKVGEIELSQRVFGAEPNIPLMHQAVVEELANQRSGTADTKTRGDVTGGGKKPYRQKGTGRARQGTIRAPHYAGGGVVFGPHPRSYEQRMPRKMRKAAIRSALSAKLADGEMVFVDELSLDGISTKKMAEIMSNLDALGKVLIATSDVTDELSKSSRNIPGLVLRRVPALSVTEVLDSDRVVVTRSAAERLEEAFAK
ncbi:MAG: 50S ribosomal protein L4 [Armatimonadetes bacterium]|nr:50S ribosomal protein L4 [Armatimonadota bacterium]